MHYCNIFALSGLFFFSFELSNFFFPAACSSVSFYATSLVRLFHLRPVSALACSIHLGNDFLFPYTKRTYKWARTRVYAAQYVLLCTRTGLRTYKMVPTRVKVGQRGECTSKKGECPAYKYMLPYMG